MTIDEIDSAAVLWRKGYDTKVISEWLRMPEPIIYANTWRIFRVARAQKDAMTTYRLRLRTRM